MADLTNTYMGLSSFDFTGGFNILGKPEALDSRVTVSNIAYIYEPTHWSFTDKNGKTRTILPYPGLIVGDHSGKAMICVNAGQDTVSENGVSKPRYCLKSSWKEIGGAALVAATAADFAALTIAENVGKTLYISSKITVGEGEAAIEYSTGLYVIIGEGSVNKLEASTTGGVDLASLSSEIETLKGDETKEGSVKYIAKDYADEAYSYAGEAHTKADEAKALVNNLNVNNTKVEDANKYVSFVYSQTNGLVNISNLTVSGLATSTYADSLGVKIDTLVGTYTGDDAKSVRVIAGEEVAKIVAGASESYDTLKEISDWIIQHPTDVAAMNTKISAIETAYVNADNALSTRIKALEDAGFLTEHQDLSSYATKTYVGQEIAKIVIPTSLSAFTNDPGYITISAVNTALNGYATQQWVTEQNYLTEHQDLSAYATQDWVGQQGYIKADYLSDNGYVTSEWVTKQNYLTEHQDLSNYATKAYVGEAIANIPECVHPDYSTTYAAYHSTYTLESLGKEITDNEAVTAAALNKLNEDYTALAGNYNTLLASFNELLAKVAVYDKKFGYVAAANGAEATFKYEYLRIDDYEEQE